MLDAMAEASQGLLKRESERAAIVVLGTAQVELEELGYQQVLDRLREAGASLNVVIFSPPDKLSSTCARGTVRR